MSNVIWKELRQTFQRNDRMVYQLIAINVVVFLGLNLIQLPYLFTGQKINIESFSSYLGLPASLNAIVHQPWTIITFMFTHFDWKHILWNMLLLYWFGKILSEFAGNKKILPVYLLGGLCGGLFYVAAFNLLPAFSKSLNDATAWGASASVMAVVFAAVTLVPDYTMFLLLFGAVRIKWIAVVIVIIDVISIPNSNPGGHIGHLGGALFGFFYVKQLQSGRDLGAGMNRVGDRLANLMKKKSDLKVSYRGKERSTVSSFFSNKQSVQSSKEERLDSILDKISQSGYDSLSKEEKDFLFTISKED
ncbi:MAG TPA: rhomboid family intramembrane serine protease [Chitinophagales bacterium]|nr:rhomboid family intramembrane serine protease [Chitinophagales bacterium]